MRDEIEKYERMHVKPFGVNPAGIESHQRYAKKFRFPFPLLSDRDRAATGAYGALKDDGQKIQRSVVLIHQEGHVVFSARGAPGADTSLPHLR